MNSTITVKVSSKNFRKGVKYAKEFGGKFDPQTKTWELPTHRNGIYNDALRALGNYFLVPVSTENKKTDTIVFSKKHDGSCPAQWGGACECQ